jgi:hypothetical protein
LVQTETVVGFGVDRDRAEAQHRSGEEMKRAGRITSPGPRPNLAITSGRCAGDGLRRTGSSAGAQFALEGADAGGRSQPGSAPGPALLARSAPPLFLFANQAHAKKRGRGVRTGTRRQSPVAQSQMRRLSYEPEDSAATERALLVAPAPKDLP